MPVTQLSDFIPAIRESGHDNTPRLVAADWLEDQGDAESLARAELIRLQCGEVSSGSTARIRELLTILPRDQFGLPQSGGTHIPKAFIRRGFVDEIEGSPHGLQKILRAGVHEKNPLRTLSPITFGTGLKTLSGILFRDRGKTDCVRIHFHDAAELASRFLLPPGINTLQIDRIDLDDFEDRNHAPGPTGRYGTGLHALLHMSPPPKVLEFLILCETYEKASRSRFCQLLHTHIPVILTNETRTADSTPQEKKIQDGVLYRSVQSRGSRREPVVFC